MLRRNNSRRYPTLNWRSDCPKIAELLYLSPTTIVIAVKWHNRQKAPGSVAVFPPQMLFTFQLAPHTQQEDITYTFNKQVYCVTLC
jgi:hypothetical protein